MNAPIRKLIKFSSDAVSLAREVGELARDLYQRTRYTHSVKTWGPGTIKLANGAFTLDVGRNKPVAVVLVDVEDTTNRTKLLPGGVQWQWIDGLVQVDDVWTPYLNDTDYKLTFLVTHDRGAA